MHERENETDTANQPVVNVQSTPVDRSTRIRQMPGTAKTLLESVAVLCGNHHRRCVAEQYEHETEINWSKVGLANAILSLEPRIRELLTGHPKGEIRD